jgi:hypothetical protein
MMFLTCYRARTTRFSANLLLGLLLSSVAGYAAANNSDLARQISELNGVDPEKIKQAINLAKKELGDVDKNQKGGGREYGGVIYEEGGVMKSTHLETDSGNCQQHGFLNFTEDYAVLVRLAKTSDSLQIYADWHTHNATEEEFSESDVKRLETISDYLKNRHHPFIGGIYRNPRGAIFIIPSGYVTQQAANEHAIALDQPIDQ